MDFLDNFIKIIVDYIFYRTLIFIEFRSIQSDLTSKNESHLKSMRVSVAAGQVCEPVYSLLRLATFA